MSALTWVGNENFRGEYAFCAATIFAMITARLGVQISRVIHIPAEENTDTDSLSRGRTVLEVLGPGANDWQTGVDPVIEELRQLCDPLGFEAHCENFEGFWTSSSNLVQSLSPSLLSTSD